jgi:hypothetical protein
MKPSPAHFASSRGLVGQRLRFLGDPFQQTNPLVAHDAHGGAKVTLFEVQTVEETASSAGLTFGEQGQQEVTRIGPFVPLVGQAIGTGENRIKLGQWLLIHGTASTWRRCQAHD